MNSLTSSKPWIERWPNWLAVPDTEETERNLFALLTAYPELKFNLVKEFWLAGTKIYEVYEIVRPPGGSQVREAAATASITPYAPRFAELRLGLDQVRDSVKSETRIGRHVEHG